MRPRTLDQLVGQRHVLGAGSALRLAIEGDRSPSMILYGPPGVGKTRSRASSPSPREPRSRRCRPSRLASTTCAACCSGRATAWARTAPRTILFLDEIHRFNKAQQDALLPAVESGLITLIGATTENPYFEVNAALLSRCAVIELEPLSDEEIAAVIARGAAELGAELRGGCDRSDHASRRRRRAQRAQHARARLANGPAEGVPLEERHVADAARKRPLRYDRAGDQHYDIISAFIKSMRGGDPDAAVYYLASMLEGGEDARFIARRMVILASEDVGNADPRALVVAVAAAQALEHVGLPEAQLNLAQAAIYLANAPKSNASAQAIWEARRDVQDRATSRRPRCCGTRTTGAPAIAGTARATSRPTTTPAQAPSTTFPTASRGERTMYRPGTARRALMAIGTGEQAPEFDLEEEFGRPRVRLADFRGKRNVLLVFHPFAWTGVCEEEALDLQANLESFHNAETDVVFVSCDTSAARQAWRRKLGTTYTFASDFWQHGAAARAYGVFDETRGAPVRGTFLIDKDGVVIWALVKDIATRRTEMVPESLEALEAVE